MDGVSKSVGARPRSARGRLLFVVTCLVLVACAPTLSASTWHQRLHSGSEFDVGLSITSVDADGAVIVGHISPGGNPNRASVARVDAGGSLLWSRLLNVQQSTLSDAVRLPDGSLVAVGESREMPGSAAGLILRFDADGNLLWARRLQGAPDRSVSLASVALAPGDALLMTGIFITAGERAAFIAAMSIDGTLSWQIELENSGSVGAPQIVPTMDGGFLFVARCSLIGGQWTDGWVVKFDALARVEWQEALGGPEAESLTSAVQRADGSFVLVGQAVESGTTAAAWIVSMSATGDPTSQWTFSAGLEARDIVATPDGGALVAGLAAPLKDLLIKLDPAGAPEWGIANALGGGGLNDLAIAANGEVLAVGDAPAAGGLEMRVLRLDATGRAADACWPVEESTAIVPTMWSRTPTSVAVIVPELTAITDAAAALEPNALAGTPWCMPREIQNLRATRGGGNAVLTWDPDPRATTHELYRGTLAAFDVASYDHASIGACDLLVATSDDAVILDGGNYYYLVIGRSASGRSPFGYASTGASLPAASPLCP